MTYEQAVITILGLELIMPPLLLGVTLAHKNPRFGK